MSFVETAIKKMQGSAGAGQESVRGAATQVQGTPSIQLDGSTTERKSGAGLKAYTHKIVLNRERLAELGMLAPEQQQLQMANQYRQIKRPLIAAAVGRGVPKLPSGNIVMVASALPGEGKTFTSINLALSMAMEQDIRVVLVDADVAKPHVSEMFGAGNRMGLLDALVDDSLDVESLVLQTDIPRLGFLPAGKKVKYVATELLSSVRMEQIMAKIVGDDNCIIVVDSPPLLLASESLPLVNVAGQIVFVVKAGVTPQQTVMDAISYLGDGKFIGVVLNQSDGKTLGTYYGGETGGG